MENIFDEKALKTIKQALHNFFRLTFGKEELIERFSKFIEDYLNQKKVVNLDSDKLKNLVEDFIETNTHDIEKYDNGNWLYLDNLISENEAYAQIFRDAFWKIYNMITTGAPEDYDYAYDLLVETVKAIQSTSSPGKKMTYDTIIKFVTHKISNDSFYDNGIVSGPKKLTNELGQVIDEDILNKICSETVYLSTAANKLVEIYGGKASNYFSVIEEFANENAYYLLPLGENKLVDKLDSDYLLETLMEINPLDTPNAMKELVELLTPMHKPTKAEIENILDGNLFIVSDELVSNVYDLLIACYAGYDDDGDATNDSIENGKELGKILSFDNFNDFPVQNIMDQLGVDENTLIDFQTTLNELIYSDTYLANIAANFDKNYPEASIEYNFDTTEMVKSFMLNNNFFVNDNQTAVDTNELLKLLETEIDDLNIVSKIIDKLVAEYEENYGYDNEQRITEIIDSVLANPYKLDLSDYTISEIYRIFND